MSFCREGGELYLLRGLSSWLLCAACTRIPPKGADSLALGLCAISGSPCLETLSALRAAAGAAPPPDLQEPRPAGKIPRKQCPPGRELEPLHSLMQE